MASLSPPINREAAEKALTKCTEDICRKIMFDHIKAAAVTHEILEHDFLDEMDDLVGNNNKMMQFLKYMKQTDLTETFVLLIDHILPQRTVVGKECKSLLVDEYEKQRETGTPNIINQ